MDYFERSCQSQIPSGEETENLIIDSGSGTLGTGQTQTASQARRCTFGRLEYEKTTGYELIRWKNSYLGKVGKQTFKLILSLCQPEYLIKSAKQYICSQSFCQGVSVPVAQPKRRRDHGGMREPVPGGQQVPGVQHGLQPERVPGRR